MYWFKLPNYIRKVTNNTNGKFFSDQNIDGERTIGSFPMIAWDKICSPKGEWA